MRRFAGPINTTYRLSPHKNDAMNVKTVVLHLAKVMGLFALSRALTRDTTRILCYHAGSLGDEHLFNPKLFCRPGLLEQRLQWLKCKGFVTSSLDALLQARKNRAASAIPLVITLDDGWYSTSSDLLPVLARYGHQPVLYLATKAFTSGCAVIDVCIRYIVWKSPLPSVQLQGFHAQLDGAYALSERPDRERLCHAAEKWLATWDGDASAIHLALERFSLAMGVPAGTLDLASRRFSYMRTEELLAAAHNGCQVELHGHVHQYVSGQSERNRADIETCRRHIVAVGLPNPRHYCYPSGAYDEQAVAMLTAAGVSTATTCRPGLVQRVVGDRRFFLPRFLDGGDVAMIEFEAEMSGVLDFLRRLRCRFLRLAHS